MNEQSEIATVLYYCRRGLFETAQKVAEKAANRFPNGNSFRVLSGAALALCGSHHDALGLVDEILAEGPSVTDDVELGALTARALALRRAGDVAGAAAAEARTLEELARPIAPAAGALALAAIVLRMAGCAERAREHAERLLDGQEDPAGEQALPPTQRARDAHCLLGWVDLASSSGSPSPLRHFNTALGGGDDARTNVDALFGMAACYEARGDYPKAIACVNLMIARMPASYVPPHLEKARLQVALKNWEDASESVTRALSVQPDCIEALATKALVLICRDGKNEQAHTHLKHLNKVFQHEETMNTELMKNYSQLFSAICVRHPKILSETYKFAERAVQIKGQESELMAELGYQLFLQGKVSQAASMYRKASNIDNTSEDTLTGITMCQVEERFELDTATQQLEFLRQVQGENTTPMVLFLSAKMSYNNSSKALPYLDKAVSKHMKKLVKVPFGAKYLTLLDPDFLIRVVREYLSYVQIQPSFVNVRQMPSGETLQKCRTILEKILGACPGLVDCSYQLARVRRLSGETKEAMALLRRIVDELNQYHVESILLLAMLYLEEGSFQRAGRVLEVGLSYNFDIRGQPLYHFINGLVLKRKGNLNEGIHALQTALSLAEKQGGEAAGLSLAERASVHLELAAALSAAGRHADASRALDVAAAHFGATAEASRVAIAYADAALTAGDTTAALRALRAVTPEDPYYPQACFKMARIHLDHRKDREAYAQCYRELVENAPGPQSFNMLGDAYVSIQDFERAIEVYERALELAPNYPCLPFKIGQALAKSHEYDRAIDCYLDAIPNDDSTDLKLGLAELYMKLGKFDCAEEVLRHGLGPCSDCGDAQAFTDRAKILKLLAEVKRRAGDAEGKLEVLQDSLEIEEAIIKRMAVESGDEEEHEESAGVICKEIAEYAASQGDYRSAIQSYEKSLNFSADPDVMMALANLHLKANDEDQCERVCKTVLVSHPDHEAASLAASDLDLRRGDAAAAAAHLRRLLSRPATPAAAPAVAPAAALARLIDVLRRAGSLRQAAAPLANALASAPSVGPHPPGLTYCMGLYEWHAGNLTEGFRAFTATLRDREWGPAALSSMLEICIDPDLLICVEGPDERVTPDRERALRTAERLLQEFQTKIGGGDPKAACGDVKVTVFTSLIQMSTKRKRNVEGAVSELTALYTAGANSDDAMLCFGMAAALAILKQTTRAKNHLKNHTKRSWTYDDAVYLERCWLLLAAIYIQSTKYEQARALLSNVFKYNKTSAKAFELTGVIAESENEYLQAAANYRKAWKYGGHTNPWRGYKMAHCYMKGRSYARALEMSKEVLQLYPGLSRMQKDIIEKSRNNLRT